MATTALVAEILIIGLETLAWIALVVASAVGLEPLRARAADLPEAITVTLLLAAAYALGIVIDRLSDSLFGVIQERRDAARPGRGRPISTMRLALMRVDDGVARFLEYQRTKVRIVRATLFNLPLIVGASAVFLFVHDLLEPTARWIIIALGAAFVVATYFASGRVESAYEKRLTEAYANLRIGAKDERRGRAAAVCYRDEGKRRGVSFLVVRTKDGRFWTFPKGHVEPNEAPHEAAAREAIEEAGVRGFVDPVPVREYLYGSGEKPHTVVAFVLRVDEEGAPHESREQRWCGPHLTRELLGKGREPAFDREHRMLVSSAMERLGLRDVMNPIQERYRRNADAFERLVVAVPEDRWQNGSPCEQWDARGVVEHVVAMHGVMLEPIGQKLDTRTTTAGDPLGALRAARRKIERALAERSLASKEVETPTGTMTFETHVDRVISGDLVLHGWDLARATGQDETMDPSEVERISDEMSAIPEDVLRRPGVLGPPVDVADDASPQDKLLAFLGRNPRLL